MKKIFGFLLMTALVVSCSNAQEEVTTTSDGQIVALVDKEEFKELMKDENAQLLDVRTPGEVIHGKIEDAMNINVHDGDFKEQLGALDKSKPVLVYCAAGSRSAKAVAIMKDMGFKEIHELKGGYNGWK